MPNTVKRPLLIAIVGPTAVGKTALSIALAKHHNTAVISADSRQMYTEIPIGTACPDMNERDEVPHYFLSHLSLKETCSAGEYERKVLDLIQNELRHKEVIILCGGSGLYVKAVLEGLDDIPNDEVIRVQLNERHKAEGLPPLLEQLKELDPVCASRIDVNNPQRVIRALEVCMASGQPYSSFLKTESKYRPFNSLLIGLRRDRSELEERITQRCGTMIQSGWIEEARAVQGQQHLNSLRTIGYSSLFKHLDGTVDIKGCQQEIITETMQFAKRQMTWFKKMKDIHWIDLPSEDLFNHVIELVKYSVHR